MISRTFFDTNVLIYSGDVRDIKKQDPARRITPLVSGQRNGVISTQAVQEFCSIGIRKFSRDPLIMNQSIRELGCDFEIMTISPDISEDGIKVTAIYEFSFWDSLIMSSALAARCEISGLTSGNFFKE